MSLALYRSRVRSSEVLEGSPPDLDQEISTDASIMDAIAEKLRTVVIAE
jgi:hypothetical protein